MGESRQFTKIERLLKQTLALCEPEHIYRGTISEFDTVDSVPKERLVKGMLVDGTEGIRRVYFETLGQGKSSIDSSLLNVGDPVIVVGRQNPLRETATFPPLIILPEKQTILFSQQPDNPKKSGPGESVLFVLFCPIIALSVLVFTLYPYAFPIISWALYELLVLLDVALGALFIGIVWYQTFVRRARVITFDGASWTNVVDFIKHRLPEEFSQIFGQSSAVL